MNISNKSVYAPNSKDSEMIVLGCMLTNLNNFKMAAEELEDSDFYYSEHKIIFHSLQNGHRKNKHVDVHLVCEDLKNEDKLKSVGGAAYITTIAQYAGTSAYVEEYIAILKEHSSKRKLCDLASDLHKVALSNEDPQKIILTTQEQLKFIERKKGVKDKFPIKFLHQFDKNFLIEEPQKKSMLLEYTMENEITAGFLPKGIVAMLVGAGGIGKTHLLAQLAVSVSTGTPWLDTFIPTEQCGEGKKGNVFFGLGENQYDDIHRILYKASKKLRKKQTNILEECLLKEAGERIAPFSFCGQQAAFIENKKPSVYFRQLKMRLMEISPPGGWSLIILDPISRLMGADAEADNAAATQFISLLEELTIDLPGNPTVLISHHVNKSAINEEKQNQTAARGASGLTDGARWQSNFAKDKDSSQVAILKMTKSNFTQIVEEIKVKKDFDGFLEKFIESPLNQKSNSDDSKSGTCNSIKKDLIKDMYKAS